LCKRDSPWLEVVEWVLRPLPFKYANAHGLFR
jgi:hypothetical protein